MTIGFVPFLVHLAACGDVEHVWRSCLVNGSGRWIAAVAAASRSARRCGYGRCRLPPCRSPCGASPTGSPRVPSPCAMSAPSNGWPLIAPRVFTSSRSPHGTGLARPSVQPFRRHPTAGSHAAASTTRAVASVSPSHAHLEADTAHRAPLHAEQPRRPHQHPGRPLVQSDTIGHGREREGLADGRHDAVDQNPRYRSTPQASAPDPWPIVVPRALCTFRELYVHSASLMYAPRALCIVGAHAVGQAAGQWTVGQAFGRARTYQHAAHRGASACQRGTKPQSAVEARPQGWPPNDPCAPSRTTRVSTDRKGLRPAALRSQVWAREGESDP